MDEGSHRLRRGAARLRVSVVDEQGRAAQPRLARWLSDLAPAGAKGVVNVALVSDARVRALNRAHRRRDYATDVLSFPAFACVPDPRASARQAPAQPSSPPRRTQRTQRIGLGPSQDWTSVSSVSSVVNRFLGDIVIARGVAKRQARDARHSELTELRVLALHGLLHLLGFDHEHDDGRMQRVERRLRRKGGLREGLIERAGP